jgi:hypothetical protein
MPGALRTHPLSPDFAAREIAHLDDLRPFISAAISALTSSTDGCGQMARMWRTSD